MENRSREPFVLKEKEIRLYGKYRTRRLVLDARDGQGKG
jgi:hypothetical protein